MAPPLLYVCTEEIRKKYGKGTEPVGGVDTPFCGIIEPTRGGVNLYNQYNPYGFPVPFGGQFNPPVGMNAQQPVFNQPAQTPAIHQTGPDWLQVPELKQVEQIQVQPGGKAWVMVQNEPIFALRVADQMGLVTTSYYRFEKIDPSAVSRPIESQEYVTRAEFRQFVDSLRATTSVPTDKEVNKG